MKKFILPVAFFTYLLLFAVPFTVSAQSSDCWKEYNDQKTACNESVAVCNKCFGSNVDPACSQNCDKATNKCTQAVDALHSCLGVDTHPLKVEPINPGHLTCEEWKRLMIVGTAENCTLPAWSLPKKYLKCLRSAQEITQEMNHPIDYVLDFDENSCESTADDLIQIKAGKPLISGSSTGTSQNQTNSPVQRSQGTNPVAKFVRDVQNYFKPSGANAGKDVKPNFSVDKPPFKDAKTQAEEAKAPNPAQAINNWIKDTFGEAAPVVSVSDAQTLGRVPMLSDNVVSSAKKKYDPQKSPYQIPVLSGEVMVKVPGSTEWTSLREGDSVTPGSTIFTGMDASALLMIQDKGVIELLPFTEITVSEQGLEKADKDGKTSMDVKLRTGEIEVNVEGGVYTGGFQVQMTNGVAGVRGTHFWTGYDPESGVSTVGVYKGTVEVKNSAGQGQTISPTSNQPEAVTIASKLSVIMLGLCGLVIAGIGAVLFMLKKRVFTKKSASRNANKRS